VRNWASFISLQKYFALFFKNKLICVYLCASVSHCCFKSVNGQMKNAGNWSLFLFVILFFTFLPSCGKKGPPVPPKIAPLPVVKDLSKNIEGDLLTLAWPIPMKKGKTTPEDLAGFKVLRVRKLLIDPDCQDCPDRYRLVADIPLQGRISNNRIIYQENLEHGYQYKFKVKLYTDKGNDSGDSNIVEFLRE